MNTLPQEVAIIAARSINGVIGRSGTVPWSIPDDMRHFKELTMGCPVIMGRRTWQSIGHPLHGRTVIVLTRNPRAVMQALPSKSLATAAGRTASSAIIAQDTSTIKVFIARSMVEALSIAKRGHPFGRVWIAGGQSVYQEVLPLCRRLCITEVLSNVEGDTYFPQFDTSLYTAEKGPVQCGGTCEGAEAKYRFVTYTRR